MILFWIWIRIQFTWCFLVSNEIRIWKYVFLEADCGGSGGSPHWIYDEPLLEVLLQDLKGVHTRGYIQSLYYSLFPFFSYFCWPNYLKDLLRLWVYNSERQVEQVRVSFGQEASFGYPVFLTHSQRQYHKLGGSDFLQSWQEQLPSGLLLFRDWVLCLGCLGDCSQDSRCLVVFLD